MPAVSRPGRPPAQQILVPRRVGLALRPEAERESIPVRKTLTNNGVPHGGEIRENQATEEAVALAVGQQLTLCTLRRAWNYIGFAVDPGDTAAVGLTARLRILGRGVNGLTAAVPIVVGEPQAFVGLIVGAACELVLFNGTGNPITHLRGSLWGMSET